MRIIQHPPASYHQATNVNNSNSNIASKKLGRFDSIDLKSNSNSNLITTRNTSNTISNISTTETSQYSADLSNLNGNSEVEEHGKFSNTFADDNINLTISTSNQNHSVKFIRNRNYSENTDEIVDNHTIETNTETFCNNLNQLNNLKSKTALNATVGNINGNGYSNSNGNVNGNGYRHQIFEENLKILEFEEVNLNSFEQLQTHNTISSQISPVDTRIHRNHTKVELSDNLRGTNGLDEDNYEAEEEDAEVEEEESCDEDDEDEQNVKSLEVENLICNENHHHINNSTHFGRSDGSISNSNRSSNFHCAPGSTCQENARKIEISVAVPDSIRVEEQTAGSVAGSRDHTNLLVPAARKNLAKLDLDRNLSCANQTQQQRHRNHPAQQLGSRRNKSNLAVTGDLCGGGGIGVDGTRNTTIRSRNRNSNSSGSNGSDFDNDGGQSCDRRRVVSYSSTCSDDTSPDDSLMEEEDVYSPTPSSCASLSSPEPGNFPRGIINPNYPGFQHLAHTLSEHFVDHHSDQDDSDLSEFEVELSVESLDENFANFHLNNNNNHVNNNNNNNDSADISLLSKHTSLTDEVNFNLENRELKQTREHKIICLPEIRVSPISFTQDQETDIDVDALKDSKEIVIDGAKDETGKLENIQTDVDSNEMSLVPLEILTVEQQNSESTSKTIDLEKFDNTETEELCQSEDISCDLDTYLKKFETVTDVKKAQNAQQENSVNDTEHDDEEIRNCPTPDILIKNDNKRHSHRKSKENRPDLLRNVSPKPDDMHFDEKISVEIGCQGVKNSDPNDDRKCRLPVPDNIHIEAKRVDKDENSFGITPVDIVGDFGREVEREFGLIVSGYNNSLICHDLKSENASNIPCSINFEKMTDAALSDGKEQFSVSPSVNSANLAYGRGDPLNATCDLLQPISALDSTRPASPLGGGIQPLETQETPQQQQHHARSQSPTTIFTHVSADAGESNCAPPTKLTTKNSITYSSQTSNSSEKLIPTAIVKPKYQKFSYDDRQLPPIGIGFSDQNLAWYDNKGHNNHQPQHHQPHHHHHHASSHGLNQNASGSIQSNASSCAGSDQRSRKIQQQFSAHLDSRSSRKKFVGRAGGAALGSRDKFGSSRRYDESANGSSVVAIVTPRKKDNKMDSNFNNDKKFGHMIEKNNNNHINRVASYANNNNNNTSGNIGFNKYESFGGRCKKDFPAAVASFDVYNIETALPVIDLEAIENHLKKAKEEERKRRNDREEIRRRLAMGAEDDYFSKIVSAERPGRKPSLQSRLQNGMNLQICFMNDASSDTESPSSDSETCPKLSKSSSNSSNMSRYSSSSASSSAAHPYYARPLSVNISGNNNKKLQNSNRPSTLSLGPPINDDSLESDFFTKQARLQIEARMALAQAKDMAHMQMEIERQKQKQSPITEVIRNSLDKVGVAFPPEKRRVSRQMLTDMNIAQLQIIVNELHSQIERLNEQLVQYLMERDDLHMGQDSMLVDIEDLTRYLGAKEQSKANEKLGKMNSTSTINSNTSNNSTFQKGSKFKEHEIPTVDDLSNKKQILATESQTIPMATTTSTVAQNKFLRIASLVKK